MKVSLFEQVPYRYLPEGFENHHNSVVTPPYEFVEPGRMTESLFSAYAELVHGARAGFDGVCVTEHSQSSYDISPNPTLLAARSPAPRRPRASTWRSPCSAARSARHASR